MCFRPSHPMQCTTAKGEPFISSLICYSCSLSYEVPSFPRLGYLPFLPDFECTPLLRNMHRSACIYIAPPAPVQLALPLPSPTLHPPDPPAPPPCPALRFPRISLLRYSFSLVMYPLFLPRTPNSSLDTSRFSPLCVCAHRQC